MATATTKKAPRVDPGRATMAARVAAAPANREAMTRVAEFAEYYNRLYGLYNQFDLPGRSEIPGQRPLSFAVWQAIEQAAHAVMLQAPATKADVLVQIGLAAAWIGTACDAIEETDPKRATLLAIATVVENATLLLNRDMPIDTVSPEIGDMIADLVDRAQFGGAEAVLA